MRQEVHHGDAEENPSSQRRICPTGKSMERGIVTLEEHVTDDLAVLKIQQPVVTQRTQGGDA
jgi:hypothetical protein